MTDTFDDAVKLIADSMLTKGDRRYRLKVELSRREGDVETTYTFTVDGGGYEECAPPTEKLP